MLRQGTIDQLRIQDLPRENTLLVITMCYYPRGVKKGLRDAYHHVLAPDRRLFQDWKLAVRRVGHEEAFNAVDYEKRFPITEETLNLLKNYSEISSKKEVYFLCQCRLGEKCHREMLLLAGRKLYGAVTEELYHQYPEFEARLAQLPMNSRIV